MDPAGFDDALRALAGQASRRAALPALAGFALAVTGRGAGAKGRRALDAACACCKSSRCGCRDYSPDACTCRAKRCVAFFEPCAPPADCCQGLCTVLQPGSGAVCLDA